MVVITPIGSAHHGRISKQHESGNLFWEIEALQFYIYPPHWS